LQIAVITDPVMSLSASLRPALFVAKVLHDAGFHTTLLAPYISPRLRETLGKYVDELHFLKIPLLYSGSLAVFEAWLRSFIYKLDTVQRDTIVLNFSSTLKVKSSVYYGQGPISSALDDMHVEMPNQYKYLYKFFAPIIKKLDVKFISYIRENTRLFVANSKYSAKLYRTLGVYVDGIIYPPLNTEHFKPITSNPSSDYVLTYFGKETKFSIVRKIADLGIKIKAFGGKAPYIPNYVLKHENIDYLGRIPNRDLVSLYSNALYTLFPFTHEPFGYVPVESMACGTPVLTYNKQGPSETVVHGVTGWLVDSDEELIEVALKIWNNGYPEIMRKNCREYVLKFSASKILKIWIDIVNKVSDTM